jgi:hypothetical protein
MVLTKRLAGLILFGSVVLACGSSSNTTGDGGTGMDSGGTNLCPAFSDVCSKETLMHVNMVCSKALTMAKPTDSASPGMGLPQSSVCDYSGGDGAQIVRMCFASSAEASFYYSNEHKKMETGVTVTDLTGIGDMAFMRVDSMLMSTKIYAIKANLMTVLTTSWAAGAQMAAQTCLTTLSNETLALK